MNGLGRKNEQKESKNSIVFTKETLGVVLVLFSTLCLICLITGSAKCKLSKPKILFAASVISIVVR